VFPVDASFPDTEPAPLAPTQALLRQFEWLEAAAAAGPARGATDVAGANPQIREVREGFAVGPLHFAMRYECGSMLTEPPPFIRLPNAAPWFHGMSNIDGTLVPVFDLAELVGVEHGAGEKQMLLVLGHGEEQAGILIDGIPRRLALSNRVEEFAPPLHLAGCIAGVWRDAGTDWMDLKHEALLDRFVELLAH
jgi:chemotaxis signal transduction protein